MGVYNILDETNNIIMQYRKGIALYAKQLKKEVMIVSVKVYSTPTCPWCTVAKRYLDSINVRYEEYDVSKDRDAAIEMVQKSGQRGVPVIDINGNIIVGFNQQEIDKSLKTNSEL